MNKTVGLESGHRAVFLWTKLGSQYAVTEIELWRDELLLGVLVRRGAGKYELFHIACPRFARFDEKVLAYYVGAHPDLAGEDPPTVYEKGFEREGVDLTPVLNRFEEMFRAISQGEGELFLVADGEGRIYTWAESAIEAYHRATIRGWKGWFSPDRADGETLAVVPMSKVRVQI